ncbi:MAG TPA: Nramp family divalent metal transporter [Syntrophales bacterium]|nr:Nramp family divalent metal transporter [Syntrophales bacterium]
MLERIRRIDRRSIVFFLSIVGPGIITANVDNDAGGIATYSVAGAQYGYALLWSLIPMLFVLFMIQEMVARLGVVTGKGLSDLIREQYGVRVTFFTMLALLITNFGNITAEFAGLAASLEIFGVSRYVSVPLGAAAVWYLVVWGNYRIVEKVFLFACTVYLSYVISGFMANPPWGEVLTAMVIPTFRLEQNYLFMLIGIIGTTIAPWMQFYQQSSIVEKEIHVKNYRYVWWDVLSGCVFAVMVVFFIMVACSATLHANGIPVKTAEDAAVALAPLAGRHASILFAIGLANASLFAASILPLSTAYSICEGMGWEAGVNKDFREAPQFMGLYTGLIVLGAALILIPGAPLIWIMLVSQVINGILLPFVLIFILLLVNNRELMGSRVNGRLYNGFSWLTVLILIVLTLILLVMTVRDMFAG